MGRREDMVALAVGVAEDDSHGYSQSRRWPWEGSDFDCSSLVYWAAHNAGYDVPESGYTGTMLSDFQAAGFTAVPWDGNIWDCEPGDILLARQRRQHTEIYVGGGRNVGAHIAETGGVDGAPGDQTGNEISIEANSGSWDWVLVPPADDSPSGGSPSQDSTGEWQGDVIGRSDTTGAGDDYAGVFGRPIRYLAIDGVGAYQVHDRGGDWWPQVSRYDLGDEENGMAGSGNPIDAVRIPDSDVLYQTHNMGGDWNDVMRGTTDTGGSLDDFAGEYGVAQDAIRIWREGGEQPRYNVFS